MMIGGEPAVVKHLDPILARLAPGIGDVPRTEGREKLGGTAEQGYLHCGPNGAGHFVKMVHNGIEYGVMAAYAEGLGVLRDANVGKQQHAVDAETTPLRDPDHYQYDLNLRDIAEVWRRGSVIASWLLDLTAAALVKDPALKDFSGHVSDSGEGRWTIKAAIDEGVPVPVLSTALYQRFSSRGEADFQDQLLSAMRFQFGGHLEKPAKCGRAGETMTNQELDQLAINTIRTLSIDAVQQAKSGHPGTPMALAPLVYTLWNRVMRFDPQDPIWPNRDRFVLSNGHASMLLWSVLHLTGTQAVNADYELVGQPSVTLDDIRRFRQLDSKAPGHPEYHWVSGVETTTGPLGQGVATSVGMAIAQKWLAARYNRPGFEIFD